MSKKMRQIFLALVLTLAPLTSVLVPGVAHASGGTFTWSGGGSDGNWSTSGNWAGGTAPQSGDVGDNIIIDNSASFTHTSIDDIASLSLASLVFENDSGAGNPTIVLSNPLTVTGPITQQSSDTTTADIIEGSGTPQAITLGANVTVTDTAGITFGGIGLTDSIALGSNTLTFTDGGTGGIVALYDNITGSGTVNFNGSATSYEIFNNDTYSGATNVNVTNNPVTTNNNNAFGTSTITVGANSEISFDYDSNATLSNPIVVTGVSSGTTPTSLDFETTGSSVTIAVPSITLNGKTQFNNGGFLGNGLTVDLSGITTNGNCINYIGGGSGNSDSANGFANGPTDCTDAPAPAGSGGSGGSSGSSTTNPAKSSAPKTPDTGLAAIKANPLATTIVTLLSVATLVVLARRVSTTK